MAKAFSHLTQDQRSQLAALRATKISLIKRAKILQVHTTTISRELARYTNAQGIYDPVAAHQQAQIAQIKFIEDRLNNRPRKALNYKTPNEGFFAFRDYAPVAIAG
jgi:IS30 family transposase